MAPSGRAVCHPDPRGVKRPCHTGLTPPAGHVLRGTATMKRTWEALRARDRGRTALARPHGSLERAESDWTAMLRDLRARLEAPSPRRPYWAVYQGSRFLAAARTPRDAIARAYTVDAGRPRA